MVIHYFSQKNEQKKLIIIFRVSIIAFLPVIFTIILSGFIDIPPFAFGAALAGLPLIPYSYFLAIGKGRLKGHMEGDVFVRDSGVSATHYTTPSTTTREREVVKVLVICPYCGAKTEQGLSKCQNCQADL